MRRSVEECSVCASFKKRNARKGEVLRSIDCERRKREMAKDEGKWEARKI